MQIRSLLTVPVLAAGSLIAAGCGGDEPPAEPVPSSAQAPEQSPAAPGTTEAGSAEPSESPESTADDRNTRAVTAIETAESEAGGTAYAIDHEIADDTWEVDVRVGDRTVEVHLDAAGTQVSRIGDEENLDNDDRTELDAAEISLTDALGIAFDETDGEIDDADITDDDDLGGGEQIVYQVSLDQADGTEREVILDVTDGRVLDVRTDD